MKTLMEAQEEQILDDWYAGRATDEDVRRRLKALGMKDADMTAWMEGLG